MQFDCSPACLPLFFLLRIVRRPSIYRYCRALGTPVYRVILNFFFHLCSPACRRFFFAIFHLLPPFVPLIGDHSSLRTTMPLFLLEVCLYRRSTTGPISHPFAPFFLPPRCSAHTNSSVFFSRSLYGPGPRGGVFSFPILPGFFSSPPTFSCSSGLLLP